MSVLFHHQSTAAGRELINYMFILAPVDATLAVIALSFYSLSSQYIYVESFLFILILCSTFSLMLKIAWVFLAHGSPETRNPNVYEFNESFEMFSIKKEAWTL